MSAPVPTMTLPNEKLVREMALRATGRQWSNCPLGLAAREIGRKVSCSSDAARALGWFIESVREFTYSWDRSKTNPARIDLACAAAARMQRWNVGIKGGMKGKQRGR